MSSTVVARIVARGLLIATAVLAVAWLIALITTGHDTPSLRIAAVVPAAVGVTLLRIFPKVGPAVTPASEAARELEHNRLGASQLGATSPAPIDIVDR